MAKLLDKKVSIITGGIQGIGKAIALKFAQEGSNIAIFDVQEKDSVKKEIEEKGVKVKLWKVDIRDFNLVEKCVEEVNDEFGGIDILVNNAGITRDNLLIRMKEKEWDDVIDINLKGAFNCSKSVAKFMMKKREGCIVNISSIIGIVGNIGQANYSASKGGLISLTKTLARELSRRNIRVNAVAPGFIKSPMTDKLSPESREEMLKAIPLKRVGLPEEVANVVFFLSSPLSSYITGEVIKIDGGMAM